jgi:hypothetical protein
MVLHRRRIVATSRILKDVIRTFRFNFLSVDVQGIPTLQARLILDAIESYEMSY